MAQEKGATEKRRAGMAIKALQVQAVHLVTQINLASTMMRRRLSQRNRHFLLAPPPPLSVSQQLEGLIRGMQDDSTNAGKWMNISTYHYYLYLYGYHQALECRPLLRVPIDSDPAFFKSYASGHYNGQCESYYSAQHTFRSQ